MDISAVFSGDTVTFSNLFTVGGYDRLINELDYFTPYGLIIPTCSVGNLLQVLNDHEVDVGECVSLRGMIYTHAGDLMEVKVCDSRVDSVITRHRLPTMGFYTYAPTASSDGVHLLDHVTSIPGDPYNHGIRNTEDVIAFLRREYNITGNFVTWKLSDVRAKLLELYPEPKKVPLIKDLNF